MIKDIGRKIRELRTAAELTQDELARRAGLTDGFISQIERGRTSISIDSLKMILDALNISLAEFFREDEVHRLVFSKQDQVELDARGFVVTNDNMETSIPGVFAVGDLRSKLLRQITTAVGEGATAAFAAEKYIESLE